VVFPDALRNLRGQAHWVTATGNHDLVRCALCGERIGVYEPVVRIDGDGPSETSVLRLRESGIHPAHVEVVHASCAPAAG